MKNIYPPLLALSLSACAENPTEPIATQTPEAPVATEVLAETEEPSYEVSEQPRVNFKSLAKKLATYQSQLRPENREKLAAVIGLLEGGLESVTVHYDGSLDSGVRASTAYERSQHSGEVTVHLDDDWNSESGIDIAILAHELDHAASILKAKKEMSSRDWEIFFSAPGNSIEIREELEAWTLHLDLINAMTNGLVDSFVDKSIKAESELAADTVLNTHLSQIQVALDLKPHEVEIMKRWLIIAFKQGRAKKMDHLDCDWGYGFATHIAGMYHRTGVTIYQITNPNPGQHPNKCLYPLDGESYTSGYVYEDMGNGVIGPSRKFELN